MKLAKIIKILTIFIFVLTLIGCGPTKMQKERNKNAALEAFKLEEFPNMELIEYGQIFYYPVYLVSTAEEFDSIRKYKDRSFIITNDLDLSSIENFQPIGTEEDPFVGEISTTCIRVYDFIFSRPQYCLPNTNILSTVYRTISNVNINITDDNYTKYVGVFGYADETNLDTYFKIQDQLKPKKLDNETKQLILQKRSRTNRLIFNNVNISVNSSKETIVGGVYGRGIQIENNYIVKSNIQGNYIVGSFMGIYDGVASLDFSLAQYSLLNKVTLNPVKENARIGGMYGNATFNITSHLDKQELILNYNDVSVTQNEFSSSVIAGGISSKSSLHRYSYSQNQCPIFNLNGMTFSKFNVADAKVGLIFGEVKIVNNSINYTCVSDDENYNNIFNLDNHFTVEDNGTINAFYSVVNTNNQTIDYENNRATVINPTASEIYNRILFRYDKELIEIDDYEYRVLITSPQQYRTRILREAIKS